MPIIINNLCEYIEKVAEEKKEYNDSIWYRGQPNEKYKLLPSFLRDEKNQIEEKQLLSIFKQNATMLINTEPKDDFDWMFLMQHHGIPTRLLDWSESPLVALYFALLEDEEEDSNADSIVWSLKPIKLNKNHIEIDEEKYIPHCGDQETKKYTIQELYYPLEDKESNPIAIMASRNNPRMQAQLGVFTIHHKSKTPIEDIGDGSHVKRYIIKQENKATIFKQLKLIGINKFQLFPELSNIKDIIQERIN